MKLRDGLTKRQRKVQKASGEHVHGRRTNRIEFNAIPGLLKDYMDNTRGVPTDSIQVGRVNKVVAKQRGTF